MDARKLGFLLVLNMGLICCHHSDPAVDVIVNRMGCTPVVVEAGNCGTSPQSVKGVLDASVARTSLQGKWNWQGAYFSSTLTGVYRVVPNPNSCTATLTFNGNGTYELVNGNSPKAVGSYVIDQQDISVFDEPAHWFGPAAPNIRMHVTLSPTPEFTISTWEFPSSSSLSGLLSVSEDGKCLEIWSWEKDTHGAEKTAGSKWVR